MGSSQPSGDSKGRPQPPKNDEYSIEELNAILKNTENFYWAAVQAGYFLPKYKSGVITVNYLTKVLNGTVFVPKLKDLKHTGNRTHYGKLTKLKIYEELRTIEP
jgi:hypothetical protein